MNILFRVKHLLQKSGVRDLRDLKPSIVQRVLGELREEGLALKTVNDYLVTVKQFCTWARHDGRSPENPLDSLQGFNTALDRRHDRRALSEDELQRLLSAAKKGGVHQGCTGPERETLYRFAVLTGLRKNEIESLTKASFDLEGDPATVTVRAAFSKHRREDIHPLPKDLAPLLRNLLAGKADGDPAFKVPDKTGEAVQHDLEAAGIPYKVGQRYADFHALRHTFITRVINSGANVKTAQLLARHSDPGLTLGCTRIWGWSNRQRLWMRCRSCGRESRRQRNLRFRQLGQPERAKSASAPASAVRRLFLSRRGAWWHRRRRKQCGRSPILEHS